MQCPGSHGCPSPQEHSAGGHFHTFLHHTGMKSQDSSAVFHPRVRFLEAQIVFLSLLQPAASGETLLFVSASQTAVIRKNFTTAPTSHPRRKYLFRFFC